MLEILKYLDNNLHLCEECCLRFTKNIGNEENLSNYIFTSQEICRCCFGILQHDPNKIIDTIVSQSKEYVNELEIFDISISIPSSTIIRDYKVARILKHLFSNFQWKDPLGYTSIKEVFKKKLVNAVEKRGLRYGPFNLKIHLKFEHPESQYEFFELHPNLDLSDYKINRTNDEKKTCNIVTDEEYNKKTLRNIIKSNRLNANLESSKYIKIRLRKVGDVLYNFKDGDDPQNFLTKVNFNVECKIDFKFESIFVCGRYMKLSRELPQTNKLDDEGPVYKESVESLIGPPVCKYFHGDKYILATAGREDIDVRMLGRGRSFLLEIINPKSNLNNRDLHDLQMLINNNSFNKVWINDLQMTDKSGKEYLKEGEIKKSKRYACIVYFREPIQKDTLHLLDDLNNLKIYQKTPIRVLHKRSLNTREKIIHSISYEYIDSHHVKFVIESQAGTYIKEFINGDFGRTKPNLAEILGHDEAFLILLDVLEVKLDWPNKIEIEKYPQPMDILEEHIHMNKK